MGSGGAADAPKVQLVGYNNFKRHNPHSDRFEMRKFHHIEFWCHDSTNTFKRCAGRLKFLPRAWAAMPAMSSPARMDG